MISRLIGGLDAQTRLLVVAPHPDDETIATGELIQRVRAAGGEVRVLLLTPGDNNPWPQRWLERRLWIGGAARMRWGLRRREEVAGALRILGVPPAALHPLGWPDLGIAGLLRVQGLKLLVPLIGQLQDFLPTLVALPALADRHPDHGVAHVLMRLALSACEERQPELITYLVHGRSVASARDFELPSDPVLHGLKMQALQCHRSQMELSAGRMRRLAGRPERYQQVEAGDGALPWRYARVPWPNLRLTVADSAGVQSWRWHEAPLVRDRAGRYRLQLKGPSPRFARLHLDVPSPWIFDHWGWCEL